MCKILPMASSANKKEAFSIVSMIIPYRSCTVAIWGVLSKFFNVTTALIEKHSAFTCSKLTIETLE